VHGQYAGDIYRARVVIRKREGAVTLLAITTCRNYLRWLHRAFIFLLKIGQSFFYHTPFMPKHPLELVFMDGNSYENTF